VSYKLVEVTNLNICNLQEQKKKVFCVTAPMMLKHINKQTG